MLRFLQRKKESRKAEHPYFPIFAAVTLSLLFSICIVHYAQKPLFLVTSSLSVSGSD